MQAVKSFKAQQISNGTMKETNYLNLGNTVLAALRFWVEARCS